MKKYTFTTYNIYKTKRPTCMETVKTLCAVNDFLALQEWVDIVDIPQELNTASCTTFIMPFRNIQTGTALVSKIQPSTSYGILSKEKEVKFHTRKSMMVGTYPIDHGTLTIFSCHALNFVTNGMWRRNMDQWMAYIPATGRVIFAGDFNTWNKGRFTYLDEKLKAIGFTYAHFEHKGFLKLDHIWVRDVSILSTLCDYTIPASDHYPVTLTFTI